METLDNGAAFLTAAVWRLCTFECDGEFGNCTAAEFMFGCIEGLSVNIIGFSWPTYVAKDECATCLEAFLTTLVSEVAGNRRGDDGILDLERNWTRSSTADAWDGRFLGGSSRDEAHFRGSAVGGVMTCLRTAAEVCGDIPKLPIR